MCGIAGIIQPIGSAGGDADHIRSMTDRLRHRGPDGAGSWSTRTGDWQITLGHRRLAIIDVKGGAQPMADTTGRIRCVYNGELYNFESLRDQLTASGCQFETRSDTEVLLNHVLANGKDALGELDGMFAFATWNTATNELLLARDRAGIKPLYYAELESGGLLFASELTALLSHPSAPRSISRSGVGSYFFLDYAQSPQSVIDGVKKLPPGHVLVWRDGQIEIEAFWTLNEVKPRSEALQEDVLIRTLDQTISESVRSQLISDVPLGVFLSGGIDSSLIAALAQQHSRERIKTFSIGFEDAQFDESAYARKVARHLNTVHVEEVFREADLIEHLDAALDSLDEPMADPSVLPTYLLSQVARRHVTVALGGDGGDELFAGYAPHKAYVFAKQYARIPKLFREALIKPFAGRLPIKAGYQPFEWKLKRFVFRWDDNAQLRHLRWMSNTDLPGHQNLFASTDRHQDQWKLFADSVGGDGLNSILKLDFISYLPGSILCKVDRASMAHSLEVRPPFLSNAMIDFAFSLPEDWKMRGRVSKYLLKRVAGSYLPDDIVYRSKKGFGIPLAQWLRGPLRQRLERILSGSALWDLGLLNRETFRAWHDEHQQMRLDHAKTLWGLIVLDHWLTRNASLVDRGYSNVASSSRTIASISE